MVSNYYASEIDKHAIKVSEANYPDIVRLGDVNNWRDWSIDWASIDLLMAGSPCQGFSFAGKQLAFDDPRSALFFVFVDIKNHISEARLRAGKTPLKFLLENVRMKKEYLDVISEHVGVEPVFINSSLVSAQNRQRYYWANWSFGEPKDKGVFWGDVREHGIDGYYYTEKALQWMAKESRRKNKPLKVHADDEKMQMVEASHYKNYSSQRFFGICDLPTDQQAVGAMRGRYLVDGVRQDGKQKTAGKTQQYIEFRHDGKTNALTTVGKDNVVVPFTLPDRIPASMFFFRYISPIECERLQTVPDNYTKSVSNTQRYKMLGNGWTVDVIVHILSHAGFDKTPDLGPCAKTMVQCVIIGKSGRRYVGANACRNPQDACPRADGEDYTKCKTICDQIGHAEEVALSLAGSDANGGRSIIKGHSHYCESCKQKLLEAGIVSMEVIL